jgi:nitrite reductase (NADH) small subunit
MPQRTIGHVSQIPPGEGRVYEVDGVKMAVFRTHAGAVHATQSACPHRHGPLADGLIDEGVLICPLHERAFDLHTGAAIAHDCEALRIYAVRADPDGAIVLLHEDAMAHAAG